MTITTSAFLRSPRRALVAGVLLLTSVCGIPVAPALATVSGANGRIAYWRLNPGEYVYHVYTVQPNGTNERQLPLSSSVASPRYSPDGRRLAFAELHSGSWIRTAKTDGSDVITVTSGGDDRLMSYALDGHEVIHLKRVWIDPLSATWDSALTSVDGSGASVTPLPGQVMYGVTPIPNGKGFAYSADRDGNSDIFIRNPDWSNERRLTTEPGLDAMADASPNGTQLLHYRQVSGGYELRLFDINVQQDRLLLARSIIGGASFSPDGSRIVVELENYDLFVLNSDGSGLHALGVKGHNPTWQPLHDPDISTSISGMPTQVEQYTPTSVSVTARNESSIAATGAVATVTIPSAFRVTSRPASCTVSGTTYTCTVGTLAGGAQQSLGFTVEPRTVGTSTTTSSTAIAQSDPNPFDNAASVTTKITAFVGG